MAYAQQMWPQAVDVRTAVDRLQCQFEAMGWDAMLNINRCCTTDEELQELKLKEKKCFDVVDKCQQFLQNNINIEILKQYFIDVGLAEYVIDFEQFVKLK